MIPKKLKTFLRPYVYIVKHYFCWERIAKDRRVVFIDIRNNPYGRHIYLPIKFLHLTGVKVYLKPYPSLLRQIYKDRYSHFIFEEKLVKLRFQKPKNALVLSDDENRKPFFRMDYYDDLINGGCRMGAFHFPISMHPLQYHYGIDASQFSESKRSRTVFFSGNFNVRNYHKFSAKDVFQMPDRIQIRDFLLQTNLPILTNIEEDRLLSGSFDNKVIINDSQSVQVRNKTWREVLSKMDFFLVMPGIFVPMCHSHTEAMSVGCIPIFHDHHAALFCPPLEHGKNALSYERLEGLPELIGKCLAMNDAEIRKLRSGVSDYYQNHLAPAAVVKKIFAPGLEMIFLEAEENSVSHLRDKM